ncbi:MAG: DeoR family transcriptional regulator [Candidatus Dormibacteraeota bacterium]|nr:DeoR family transcriptional regulator [Candidatus Dormibacteraeota bacterium]
MNRAARLARQMGIVVAVTSQPGVRPAELAQMASISERTLRRDLSSLRRDGYHIRYSDGYQIQEVLPLDAAAAPSGIGGAYARQLRLVRSRLPERLAEQIERELEAEAPAALAGLVAQLLKRHR